MRRKTLAILITVFCVFISTACSNTSVVDSETGNAEPTTEVIFDVTRFIGASYDDVIDIMGEPYSSRDDGLTFCNIPYSYDGWDYYFGYVPFDFSKRNGRYEVSSIDIWPVLDEVGAYDPLIIDINDDILAIFGIKSDVEPVQILANESGYVLFWDAPIDGIMNIYCGVSPRENTKEIYDITFEFKDRI